MAVMQNVQSSLQLPPGISFAHQKVNIQQRFFRPDIFQPNYRTCPLGSQNNIIEQQQDKLRAPSNQIHTLYGQNFAHEAHSPGAISTQFRDNQICREVAHMTEDTPSMAGPFFYPQAPNHMYEQSLDLNSKGQTIDSPDPLHVPMLMKSRLVARTMECNGLERNLCLEQENDRPQIIDWLDPFTPDNSPLAKQAIAQNPLEASVGRACGVPLATYPDLRLILPLRGNAATQRNIFQGSETTGNVSHPDVSRCLLQDMLAVPLHAACLISDINECGGLSVATPRTFALPEKWVRKPPA